MTLTDRTPATAVPIHRLVYFSRNRIDGGSRAVNIEVEDILAASRRNNARKGITGALIFNAGVFAQVLEGSARDIEATFERIQRDTRHGEVSVLAFGPVDRRLFPDWSMGFIGRSRTDRELFAGIGKQSGFDADRFNADRIVALMRDIALDEETRAA